MAANHHLVDLLCIQPPGHDLPPWSLGEVRVISEIPDTLAPTLDAWLEETTAPFVLFWDLRLGPPDEKFVRTTLDSRGDLWHAGLRLGMRGVPTLMDCVASGWMLARDPDPAIEATSWRLSLRACLARTDVLRQLGGIRGEFQSLEGAAAEMGHRFVVGGALMRHVPSLVSGAVSLKVAAPPFEDELRFIYCRHGRFWSSWATMRALLTFRVSPARAVRAWLQVHRTRRPPRPSPYRHPCLEVSDGAVQGRVSILIPTLDRYPYLRTLLRQLHFQTVAPVEIIIVDQTPAQRRDRSLAEDFPELPMKVICQDRPGQCTARNAGLNVTCGDYLLFLDDDVEVVPTLIEDHLKTLQSFRADVSAGVAEEVGVSPLSSDLGSARVSDVFPTCNTMIRLDVLNQSGLFDLAYDGGEHEDGDLGMRVYLSGALMVLNPSVSVLHHHAPSGGLRTHKARVVTYVSSRQSLTRRRLPSVSDLYLAGRYFSPRQVREMMWQSALGTFAVRGGPGRKALKLLIGLLYLPNTLWRIRKRSRQAEKLRKVFPKIPALAASPAVGEEIMR